MHMWDIMLVLRSYKEKQALNGLKSAQGTGYVSLVVNVPSVYY